MNDETMEQWEARDKAEKQKQLNKERQQRYRDKAKGVTPSVTKPIQNVTVEPENVTRVTESNIEEPTGQKPNLRSAPLEIYSEHRWQFLQARGYVWDESRGRAYHHERKLVGVTVPGDPGYKGIYKEPAA